MYAIDDSYPHAGASLCETVCRFAGVVKRKLKRSTISEVGDARVDSIARARAGS